VPPVTAISLLRPSSVVLRLTARALARWVFLFRYSSEIHFYCPQPELVATTQTTQILTNINSTISVVQTELISIVSIRIGPKLFSNMLHLFFNSIYFKFPNLNVPTLTSTSIVTFQYICLALQGDDGGPLIYQKSDNINTQVGIFSFGSVAGCQRGYPVVFTRVGSYFNWISSITGIRIV
jgi:hypothetical protein